MSRNERWVARQSKVFVIPSQVYSSPTRHNSLLILSIPWNPSECDLRARNECNVYQRQNCYLMGHVRQQPVIAWCSTRTLILLGTSIVIQDILLFNTFAYLSILSLTIQDYFSRQSAFLNSAFARRTVIAGTGERDLLFYSSLSCSSSGYWSYSRSLVSEFTCIVSDYCSTVFSRFSFFSPHVRNSLADLLPLFSKS